MKTIFGNLLECGESVLIPSAVHLPKVDTPKHVIEFAEMFEQVQVDNSFSELIKNQYGEGRITEVNMFIIYTQCLWFNSRYDLSEFSG